MLTLSIRQPWAALIVHGIKSIEVRSWRTKVRGPIFIHAGLIADERPLGWSYLPVHLRTETDLRGGIVGVVELRDCLHYDRKEPFVRDCSQHLNDPAWFNPKGLYGFQLADPRSLPFHGITGWTRFFQSEHPEFGETASAKTRDHRSRP